MTVVWPCDMVVGQFTVDLSALQAKCDAGWLERWAAEDGAWGVTTVTGDSGVRVCDGVRHECEIPNTLLGTDVDLYCRVWR